MNKKEYAQSLFEGHLNCAQSVFSAFEAQLETEAATLQKLGSNFGGGMGEGEICGAASAAFMILGLIYGTEQSSTPIDKEESDEIFNRYKSQFIEKFNSLKCKDLIGFNLKIPEEHQKAIDNGVFQTKCPLLVSGSVEILEGMIK